MDESTLKLVRKGIENYFNKQLKESLDYHEDVKVEIDTNNYTTFIIQFVHHSRQFLYNNEKIIDDIRLELLNAFQFLNVRDIIIRTNTKRKQGTLSFITMLTIELLFEPFKLEEIPDIGIYSNIASNLTEQGLNELCRTDKRFIQLCTSQQFWTNLLIQKFPKYNFDFVNNPEQLYKGLLHYIDKFNVLTSKREGPRSSVIHVLIKKYLVTFLYLIKHNILTKEFIINNIMYIFESADINLLDEIYNMYPDVFTEDVLESFNDIVLEEEQSFDKYRWVLDKRGIELNDQDLLELILRINNRTLPKEILEYLKDKLTRNQVNTLITIAMNESKYWLVKLIYNIVGNELSGDDIRPLFLTLLDRNL